MRVASLVLFSLVLAACGGQRGNLFVRDGVEHLERYQASGDDGERTKALDAFRRALVTSRGTVGANTGLAVLEKDPKKALAHLDEELDAHPDVAAARFDRALLLLARATPEDAKKALADLDKLPAQGDPEVDALRVIARFMAGASQDVPPGFAGSAAHAALLAAWQRVKDDPTTADTLPDDTLAAAPRLRAVARAHAHQWDQALAALPETPDAAVDRAIALAWLDRLDEARALVIDALRRNPTDQRAHSLAATLE